MKLNRHSLFLKIFVWFWATVVVTGIALILTFIFQPHSVPSQWESTLKRTAQFSGSIAVEEAEKHGQPAAADYLARIESDTRLRACLFNQSGDVIAGSDCTTFRGMIARVAASKNSVFSLRFGIARVALPMQGSSARDYIYATELPAGPRAALGVDPAGILLKWGVALVVSGSICYLLARYLTAPILRLREASQQLAAGNLSTRAAASIERRQDELGDLVRDFNAMAARIEELVSRQRQLLSDVSHELRSPLARLNVALDLGRERKGPDPAFDHMEQDLEMLNDLIERLLTVARLGELNAPVSMTSVDLAELVSQIARDAEFESRKPSGGVNLTAPTQCVVVGNAELLRSAIENVVRNAIRYSEPSGPVEIVLEPKPHDSSARVRLMVRDFGPGVPESELANIFLPFYRVSEARDRQSGGTGLGLAIASRVVQIHGGTIRALNAYPGLLVEILLPGLQRHSPYPS